MRVGIVGTGFMGSTHAAAWAKTGASIAGFLAETEAEAWPACERYGCRTYTALDDLIRDVDVLDVCSPTHLHHDMVIAAARAGRHAICEKPLARTVAQGRDMIAEAERAGTRLFVAQVVRYFPEYALARERVASGDIGEVGTARYRRLSYRPKKPVGNWFLDEEKSGGIVLDLMIHDFDFARWVAGPVTSVYAKKVSIASPASPVDYGMAILSHASGALSHVAGAWAYPPPVFRTGFEISGSKGMISHDSAETAPIEALLVKAAADAPDVGLPSSPLAESPYDLEIRDFCRCLTDGGESRLTARDALAALMVAEAALESARTGRAVSVDTEASA